MAEMSSATASGSSSSVQDTATAADGQTSTQQPAAPAARVVVSKFFPHCTWKVDKKYGGSCLTPLAQSANEDFEDDVSNALIHRRLLRLMQQTSTIALFPFLISPMKGSMVQNARGGLHKDDDWKQCFTFASFMAWELGDRRLRFAMVESPPPVDQAKTAPSHIWVIGIYRRGHRQGCDLFFWDESAQETLAEREGHVIWRDVVAGQRSALSLLQKDHGIKVNKVWWGGDVTDVCPVEYTGIMCVESSMRFMERFGEEVEAADGVVDADMLSRWHMNELKWR